MHPAPGTKLPCGVPARGLRGWPPVQHSRPRPKCFRIKHAALRDLECSIRSRQCCTLAPKPTALSSTSCHIPRTDTPCNPNKIKHPREARERGYPSPSAAQCAGYRLGSTVTRSKAFGVSVSFKCPPLRCVSVGVGSAVSWFSSSTCLGVGSRGEPIALYFGSTLPWCGRRSQS